MKRKVVFDTSTMVSAAIRPQSIPFRAFYLVLSSCQFCTSSEHLDELDGVFRRPRFDSYVDLGTRLQLLQVFKANARMYAVGASDWSESRGACRDGKDDYLLSLAIAAGADLIVSSDKDLIVLNPWRGISILTPAQFLSDVSA